MPRTNESGIPREQQMLVIWYSDDKEAKRVKEFVEMVCNAVARGWEQRRLDEERLG